MFSSGRNSTNGTSDSDQRYPFARIPNRTKHKVALCLNFKFLPKKNIVKKLYIFSMFSVEKFFMIIKQLTVSQWKTQR